jgi:hypothetical protein
VPDMLQAQSFYEGHSLFQGLTWEFILERIGQDLREHYDVPRECRRTCSRWLEN